VPLYFVATPTSIEKNNPGAVSGVGVGTFFTDLRWNYPNPSLNFSSAVHLNSSDQRKRRRVSAPATQHGIWRTTSTTPSETSLRFLDFGAGNTVMDTRFFHRPFITFGYNAQFNGGIEYDPGKFSFSASAYDVAPWGNQTVISRVFRCGASAKCSSGGATKNRKSFTTASVSTGAADLVRDNGLNAGIDYKPVGLHRLGVRFQPQRSSSTQQLLVWRRVDLSWILHAGAH